MEQRGRRVRDRKNQLAAVAAELFRTRGYRGVGINDIAAAAGITGPALYRHFTDKQSILSYVLLSGLAELERGTSEALSALESGQIEAVMSRLAAGSVERRDTTALWRWEGRHLSPEDQKEIGRRSSAMLSTWAKMLLTVRPELPAADAELLCWAALSVFGSVSVHHTSVARQRFVTLLVDLAKRVLYADLPAEGPEPGDPVPGLGNQSRREQLLSAAAELFHQRGFHAVSMEDIGAAAGIAGPSVYKHFPSKAALLCAIARRAADRLAVGAEHAIRTSATEAEALRALVESYVRVLTSSPELAVGFAIDGANIPEQDRADLLRVQRDYVTQWVNLLVAARPGLNAREAKIIVHAALTVANDLTRTRRIASRPRLPADLVALMAAVLND
ncbi:MAG TPA: TetR family transcriptional regulator [Amycolatopsis sp.]|uniref:TetR/AcrR family transcriptional regulator n=1 Tax=Amycolatopsis sp. TaxID=37632 RepID=UPI002B46CABB|nr:TetR family transcriptional regulator [Amycolatopsis sp.]HKS44822.1 TetR family transcriptional regulator [Amycolatopsis sp.]